MNEVEGLINQKCPQADLRLENSLTNSLFGGSATGRDFVGGRKTIAYVQSYVHGSPIFHQKEQLLANQEITGAPKQRYSLEMHFTPIVSNYNYPLGHKSISRVSNIST